MSIHVKGSFRPYGFTRGEVKPRRATPHRTDRLRLSEKADFNNRVSDMANLYDESKPQSLGARNLISRKRFALEMVETGLAHPL